jgi:rhodanese-related sulfurtransferase
LHIILAGFTFAVMAEPVAAQKGYMMQPSPSLEAMQAKCQIGSAKAEPGTEAASYRGTGPTPVKIPGVVTVSPEEAKCVLDRFPGTVLVVDAADGFALPDALDMGFASQPMVAGDKIQTDLARVLGVISGGNKAMPILVYCHHSSCQLSYYAAQRMAAAGYGSVLWMRNGEAGWRKAGFPTGNWLNRWKASYQIAVDALTKCLSAPLPKDTTDSKIISAKLLANCTSQEQALDSAVGPWYPTTQAATMVRRTMNRARSNLQHDITARLERASREASADKWRRRQGFGLSASELMSGYEYCFASADDAGYQTTVYISSIFPVRIAKSNANDLAGYNRLNGWASPERGQALADLVIKKFNPAKGAGGGCFFFLTLSEATASWNKARASPSGRDFPWKPNP